MLTPRPKDNVDVKVFPANIGQGRKIVHVRKKNGVYLQGDPSNAAFYIKKGRIRLTVLSKNGKEAAIAILNAADFFGEGCLAGQPLRMGSATAMTDCELMRIENKAMQSALHRERALSDMFVAYLLARNIRYEEDLVEPTLQLQRKTIGPNTPAVSPIR